MKKIKAFTFSFVTFKDITMQTDMVLMVTAVKLDGALMNT